GDCGRGVCCGCAAAVAAPAWNTVLACGDAVTTGAGVCAWPCGCAHGDCPPGAAWYGWDGVTWGALWIAPGGNIDRQRSHVHALCGGFQRSTEPHVLQGGPFTIPGELSYQYRRVQHLL